MHGAFLFRIETLIDMSEQEQDPTVEVMPDNIRDRKTSLWN